MGREWEGGKEGGREGGMEGESEEAWYLAIAYMHMLHTVRVL